MNKFVIKLVRPNGRDAAQTQRNVHIEADGFSAALTAVGRDMREGKLHMYPGEFMASISLSGYH